MVDAIAWNDKAVSLPPKEYQQSSFVLISFLFKPLRIAAFPDLIAREAMLAMTSGRASNIMRSTPMGLVSLSSSRPSSKRVRNVILLTTSHRVLRSRTLLQDLLHDSSVIIHDVQKGAVSPGSSRSRTSRIPFTISSHFPFLRRSNLLITLWLSSPFSAAFVACSRSFALAARIEFFALCRASYIAVNASLRASHGRIARRRDAVEADWAISKGDESVKDILRKSGVHRIITGTQVIINDQH